MADPRPTSGAALSGAGLRDLLSSGIAGLESVPAIRAASSSVASPVRSPVATASALPPIEYFLYRGPAALAAARALADRMARAAHPPTPADLEELHDLLRLADEG